MSDKKDNNHETTIPFERADAQKILEKEIKREGSVINGFYEGVLGTAHPYLREFCDNIWLQAIEMGSTLQDLNQKSITDPKIKQNFSDEINKMAKSMQGMSSPLDILKEGVLKASQEETDSEE